MARRVVSGSLFNESWVQLDEEVGGGGGGGGGLVGILPRDIP